MFFDDWPAIYRVVIVGVLAYAALVVLLRLTGKRSLAKLNAFDFVVTVALGSTLATVLLIKDISLAEGVLALVMLLILQWLVSRLSVASGSFRKLVRSDPKLLFENGAFLDAAMAKERVTRAEVEAAIRKRGHGRLDRVSAVVLETDGSMSVIAGDDASTLDVLRSVQR